MSLLRCTAVSLLLFTCLAHVHGQQPDKAKLAEYRRAGTTGGDPMRGKKVFESKSAGCANCHVVSGRERKAGPPLTVVGDKLSRDQLIRAVLEPSARLHPDYTTIVVATSDGKQHSGVLQKRTDKTLHLFNVEGKPLAIPLGDIDEERSARTSLMPAALDNKVNSRQFADLIAYLTTLRQTIGEERYAGMPAEIRSIASPVKLVPLHAESMKFDHPVWIIAKPGTTNEYLVVEQKTRKIWKLTKGSDDKRELFADLSHEASTGQFEGVMCLAFHPDFLKNGRYFLNYHIRRDGEFTPWIVERKTTDDLSRDAGGASKRLLKIKQETDLHWGGMIAFGPDGYLYIGAGDGGPQEDPEGHSQDLSRFLGSILRIDVNDSQGDRPYGIPKSNPFVGRKGNVRPEIWAYGFRMPWRFSWDSKTGDLWVGDIGQNLFEEVTIARLGENHGWNVYEGFTEFSDRYRRNGETYTQPVFAYRRRYGVSVTAGYVYRGNRSPSFHGAFIFGDFESKRLWALKQKDRKLIKVRQIGTCPEKPSSFGIDADGELFVVGYGGTIYRLILDEAVFD